MNRESKKLKEFIAEFNFPDPNWTDLPAGFPSCEQKNLNKEEKGLYSGIVFAWINYKKDVFKEEFIQEKILQNSLFNHLYLSGKILFYLLIFVLITGNLVNYILIEVYHSIL